MSRCVERLLKGSLYRSLKGRRLPNLSNVGQDKSHTYTLTRTKQIEKKNNPTNQTHQTKINETNHPTYYLSQNQQIRLYSMGSIATGGGGSTCRSDVAGKDCSCLGGGGVVASTRGQGSGNAGGVKISRLKKSEMRERRMEGMESEKRQINMCDLSS